MSFLELFMKNNNSEVDVSDTNVGNKLRFLSLFSGIGAFEKALDNLEIPYELVGFSEIDKYAVKSYCAIHGVDESMNLGDITKVDENTLPNDIDLITYGFPCQDISLAGKQKGLFNDDGTQTRSGLFFEALRIIEAAKPRIAIAENVKNLTSKKFSEQFKIVLDSLEEAGYNNYWKVLNAKDYGIPQNRERVFIISIRKDIDDGKFAFPEPVPLELRLKDMLEEEVDESYFISKNYTPIQTNGNVVGMLDMKGNECIRRIYDTEKEAPALTTMEGGHRQPKVLVQEAKIQKVCNIYPSGGQNGNVYDENGISPTLSSGETNTKGNGGIGSSNAPKVLVRESTQQGKE